MNIAIAVSNCNFVKKFCSMLLCQLDVQKFNAWRATSGREVSSLDDHRSMDAEFESRSRCPQLFEIRSYVVGSGLVVNLNRPQRSEPKTKLGEIIIDLAMLFRLQSVDTFCLSVVVSDIWHFTVISYGNPSRAALLVSFCEVNASTYSIIC